MSGVGLGSRHAYASKYIVSSNKKLAPRVELVRDLNGTTRETEVCIAWRGKKDQLFG